MSTRGIYGFRVNETDKLAYSHADSYPDVLGATVLNQLSEVDDWPTVKRNFKDTHVSSALNMNALKKTTAPRSYYPIYQNPRHCSKVLRLPLPLTSFLP